MEAVAAVSKVLTALAEQLVEPIFFLMVEMAEVTLVVMQQLKFFHLLKVEQQAVAAVEDTLVLALV